MNSPYDTYDSYDVDLDQPDQPISTGRRRLPAWLAEPTAWIMAGAAVVALTVLAGVLWLAWLLLIAIIEALAAGARAAGGWLAHGPIVGTVTDPVRAYLQAHAGGLPATADQLWWAWLAITGALLVLAVAGARGARVGWLLAGVATAGMVYAGAPQPGRALAAGLTVLIWALLSVPAFAGYRPTRLTVTITAPMTRTGSRHDDQPTHS